MDSRTLEIILISQHQKTMFVLYFVLFSTRIVCLFVSTGWQSARLTIELLSPQEYRAGLRHRDLPAGRRGQSLHRWLPRQLQPGRVRDGAEETRLPLHHHLLSPVRTVRRRLLDIFPRPSGCYSW